MKNHTVKLPQCLGINSKALNNLITNKRIFALFIFISTALLCSGCNKKVEDLTVKNDILTIDKLKNGDAKFYDNDHIITNVGGKLEVIDFNGVQKKYDDISMNWFSIEKSDKTIVYSNANKTVNILRLDNKLNVIENNKIIESDNLPIDPSIIKIGNTYYITVTIIEGNVNNADPKKENGVYTVRLFSSQDTKNWSYMGDILKDVHNIEDIVPYYINDKFYLFYEREEIDKGNSSLEAIYSENNGIDWSEPVVLKKADSDNELGNVLYNGKGFDMYYSSDILNKGASYDGASIYIRHYDNKLRQSGDESKISDYYGALLYDVKKNKNDILFLYTEKYITESNLVISRLS